MSESAVCLNCGVSNRHDSLTCECGQDLVRNKQMAIMRIVQRVIRDTRRDGGLSPLCYETTLGEAAESVSRSFVRMEDPDAVELVSEYRRRAIEVGYPGLEVLAAFHRNIWPRDAPNTDIAGEILDYCTIAQDESWEDFGVGIATIFSPESPWEFGFCVVLGFGYTDGSALVVNQINEERKKAGIAPVEVHRGLRHMARSYIGLDEHPEHQQVISNLEQVGYAEPGDQVRYAYLGTYAPFHGGRVVLLNARERAEMVAREFLKEYREILTRSDWQHIGLAIDTRPILTPHEPRVPSILAESLIAWQLERGAKRPAHFPPLTKGRIDIEAASSTTATSQTKRGWRRWWPFS